MYPVRILQIMNERQGSSPENIPLTPQDHIMQIRGYFEDSVGNPEFQLWKTALNDVIEIRQLEQEKKKIIKKSDEPFTFDSKVEDVKQSLLSQWKKEDAKIRGADPRYAIAFRLISASVMSLELAHKHEGNKNPLIAADTDLEQLKEYISGLDEK